MIFKMLKFLKNNFFELLFLMISALFFSSNNWSQNDSVTYTYLHLTVIVIELIYCLFTIHYLLFFISKYNIRKRKIDIHFKNLEVFREQQTLLHLTNIKVIGYLFIIYSVKILLISLKVDTTIFYLIYSIVCYIGQKSTEVYIIILIRQLYEMVSRTFSGFYSTSSSQSSKLKYYSNFY